MERLPGALALLLVLAAGAAGAASGLGVGAERMGVGVAVWDVYDLRSSGGVELELRWFSNLASVVGGTDYDMILYKTGAFGDGALEDHEILKRAQRRATEPRIEEISIGAPAGVYTVAVIPFESRADGYSLQSPSGTLSLAGQLAVPRCPIQNPCR